VTLKQSVTHISADAYSFLGPIVRINCSNTHTHTQTARQLKL